MSEYKICNRCIMDTSSDPDLKLDENGVCNYCHEYDEMIAEHRKNLNGGAEELAAIVDKMKREGRGKQYDCMLGISGGVDSSYLAYWAKQNGLRVLAVHVDTGWNSELAVQNIENICKKLGYDLHTVVIDWPTMKELQRAYMFSGMANLDVPQDHCFVAATYQMAKKFHIKYMLNGFNYATEGILSKAFQYNYWDWINMKGIYRACGRGGNLKKYPHINFFDRYIGIPYLHNVEKIYPLNYIEYSQKMAISILEKEFGWRYYGGKHYESRFTKFFQESYLPERYGWYKRRDHISSLIVGGEMTREEGLKEMKTTPTTEHEISEEKEYVLKKLDITEEEYNTILTSPYKSENDYPNSKKLIKFFQKVKRMVMRNGIS